MLNSIRQAVYTACAATGLKVYDYWVVNGSFPYIIIADVAVTDTIYKQNTRNDVMIDIHVFVKEMGKTQTLNHINSIKNSLNTLDAVGLSYTTRILNEKEIGVAHGVLTISLKKYL